MTDKQKEAIGILNRLHGQGSKAGELLTDEEYYALMEFVIGEQPQQQVTYIPYTPFVPDTTPRIQPYYTTAPQDPLAPPYRVTCKQD